MLQTEIVDTAIARLNVPCSSSVRASYRNSRNSATLMALWARDAGGGPAFEGATPQQIRL